MIRFKEAFTDMAETLRRVFQDPLAHAVILGLSEPSRGTVELLESKAFEAPYRFQPVPKAAERLPDPRLVVESMPFQPRLRAEDSWERWASGAVVCEMPVFRSGGCARVGVPPLPRSASIRRVEAVSFRASARAYREWVADPEVRGGCPSVGVPGTRQALNLALGLPISVLGQSFQQLPKALGMRYTLQLVKASGENIRNLEILGVYLIPQQGVRSLKHDPRTGRVLLELGPEASRSSRAPFILARKKDDRSFVSCFVED